MMDSAQTYGATTNREYAGFWLRFVAYFIDGLILSLVQMPIWFIVGLVVGATKNGSSEDAATGLMLILWPIVSLLCLVMMLGYFAGFECTKQATPGKMALGLQVTDINGNRLNFMHATGRNAGKIVSGLILNIGYIMAGFTERKQALHDMMAGTLVVRKPR